MWAQSQRDVSPGRHDLSMTSQGSGPVPAQRRRRPLTDELALQAQTVDLLALRVAVSGELASDLRARALGLHLSTASAAVREHVGRRRDVVVPVLAVGEAGEPLAACLESADRVLAVLPGLAPGVAALLCQTAGVSALQELGMAVRVLWSALVDHERLWAASAAPLARRQLLERSAAGSSLPLG